MFYWFPELSTGFESRLSFSFVEEDHGNQLMIPEETAFSAFICLGEGTYISGVALEVNLADPYE
jgi:hypothetical protein